jgi:hypothetical protein
MKSVKASAEERTRPPEGPPSHVRVSDWLTQPRATLEMTSFIRNQERGSIILSPLPAFWSAQAYNSKAPAPPRHFALFRPTTCFSTKNRLFDSESDPSPATHHLSRRPCIHLHTYPCPAKWSRQLSSSVFAAYRSSFRSLCWVLVHTVCVMT